MDEARPVWEGMVGDTALRVEVHPSGRIAAQWRGRSGAQRRVVVNTIEELERSVLFQLMLTAPPEESRPIADEIADAVAAAKVGLPDPTTAPRPLRRKRRPPRRGGYRPRRR